MPMFKIFVGNLDPKVTVEMLTPMFAAFGELDEVIVAKDEDGKSRGFAIVLYKDSMKGQLAIETLTGRKILGREIVINEAMKKGKKKLGPAETEKPRGPFGPKFGGGGGVGGRSGSGSRPGGFSRGTAGGSERRGSAGGSGFSRNPRRGSASGGSPQGLGGASRPPAGPTGPAGRPPLGGPGGTRPPAGGPPKARPDDED
jgi:RNA recognition motif-containing protein